MSGDDSRLPAGDRTAELIAAPRRLSPGDVLRVGAVGLRARPLRVTLSALGIAIGIAAMLAVVGISASGRAHLESTLEALGTNLLSVENGADDNHESAPPPNVAVAMIERIGPVINAAGARRLPDDVHVYRNDRVPSHQTNGIIAYSTDIDLPATVGATVAHGSWLNAAIAAYPGVVLGASAAERLGITSSGPGVLVQIGDERFNVVGILHPVQLVPSLDDAALVGPVAARRFLRDSGPPSVIYLRAVPEQVTAVREVLAATANPAAPYTMVVSRPSDALAAKLATERALNGLLLGLGAVALLVGGVGVANTMAISVLERRAEIGLRRALGATRANILLQFLAEALMLATVGGLGGAVLGSLVTAVYAWTQHWPVAVPGWALGAGIAATMGVGVVAGLYPAVRAARLSPTEALSGG